MKVSKKEYAELNKKLAPKSSVFKDCTYAFFIGGAICTLGELFHTAFVFMGFTGAKSAFFVSASLIVLSAIFTSLGWYQKIASKAGAGTLVPITGFANAVVAPAIEFKCEGFITGVGAKMFIIAGPVIVYGVLSGTLYGLIYFLITGGAV